MKALQLLAALSALAAEAEGLGEELLPLSSKEMAVSSPLGPLKALKSASKRPFKGLSKAF